MNLAGYCPSFQGFLSQFARRFRAVMTDPRPSDVNFLTQRKIALQNRSLQWQDLSNAVPARVSSTR